jgi:PAS domain S-box-containing protein
MLALNKRFSVITGFVILLVVLAVNTWVTRQEVDAQAEEHAWVVHTEQVVTEFRRLELLLKNAETGQRGFLYSGDPKYLAPYDLAAGQVDSEIDKLADLTADNPNHGTRIPFLRQLAHDKLNELAMTISLYRSNQPEEARKIVLSDAGLSMMDDIQSLINEMVQEESSLLAVRTEAYTRSVRNTVASIYLTSIFAGIGLLLLAYYILREMALRERHAAQIRDREQWFRVTLTSVGDGVIATDPQGYVTFLNPVAEGLIRTTLEEVRGKPIHEAFPILNEYSRQPVENPVQKVMASGKVVGLANHTVLQSRDGTLIPIEDSAAPIRDDSGRLVGVVLVFRDATHDRKSQELLRKTEKLAAAARLAATVAHEINNPLEAVGNLIYLAKAAPGMPAAATQQLTLAETELDRVSHITRQTLGFYHESNAPDKVEVPALVESVLKLYSNKFRSKNIIVECNFGECPPIQGWPGELKQLISNLVSNAADAVSANGTLKVALSSVEHSDGEAVQLRIEDNGPGIAEHHLDRIFEPFFTTKKDVGTGLGLWVAREIAERHGGDIQVQSRTGPVNHGTVFTVLLVSTGELQSQVAETA